MSEKMITSKYDDGPYSFMFCERYFTMLAYQLLLISFSYLAISFMSALIKMSLFHYSSW